MAKKPKPAPPAGGCAVRQHGELQRILEELKSTDDQTRAEAVRQLCPCRTAWDIPVQRYIYPMENDPSPSVRHEVQHVLYEDGSWGKKAEFRRVKAAIDESLESGEWINDHSLGFQKRKRPLVKRAYYPPIHTRGKR